MSRSPPSALNTGLGAPTPNIVEFSVWYSVPMAIAINIVNPTHAQLPEESSFRGWAQPTLQATRTPLAATVLMAIGVTIWHGPLFLMPHFGLAPIEALTTAAVTFWYAWLFNHASGSSLLTLIAHAAEGAIETSTLWPAGVDAAWDALAQRHGLVHSGPRPAGVQPPLLDPATGADQRPHTRRIKGRVGGLT